MFNTTPPPPSELPTSRQLLRSTMIALAAAVLILVTVVLPAEYGIDPTGIGSALGLTDMGKIKTQLAIEAAKDALADAGAGAAGSQAASGGTGAGVVISTALPTDAQTPVAAGDWRDVIRVVLKPGEGAEVKLVMRAGESAEFNWIVEGGAVNYDMHGEGTERTTSYEKGRNAHEGQGTLAAAFDGNHGWFWRNRGNAVVTVVVRARGQYAQAKRVM